MMFKTILHMITTSSTNPISYL